MFPQNMDYDSPVTAAHSHSALPNDKEKNVQPVEKLSFRKFVFKNSRSEVDKFQQPILLGSFGFALPICVHTDQTTNVFQRAIPEVY